MNIQGKILFSYLIFKIIYYNLKVMREELEIAKK